MFLYRILGIYFDSMLAREGKFWSRSVPFPCIIQCTPGSRPFISGSLLFVFCLLRIITQFWEKNPISPGSRHIGNSSYHPLFPACRRLPTSFTHGVPGPSLSQHAWRSYLTNYSGMHRSKRQLPKFASAVNSGPLSFTLFITCPLVTQLSSWIYNII